MSKFIIIVSTLMIIFAAVVGLDGDNFTKYLAMYMYALGGLGLLSLPLFKKLCAHYCETEQ
ncbi:MULTISPECIES: hypothetical protein [unclassified Oleiphilus]|uniref:hypothetical protein n=1 Tax=unclassified Oleiphilus TaxID=2631174 RepID=UPI0007C3231C|nr:MULTISPECIES: hypothetical protein [unclassified Oleiphilus]KZY72853.1 hypothetical protein A3740_20110 [Oleiphilus sp. HI0068]KZY77871.1 hypothetical protein A3741_01345 [Oleiphilus sp. HI0069]KZY86819.1 hypothetical protein A3743_16095 [Oleiphilus sp. HI0072]KZZ12205.1 hypothetical protein A3749_06910 [Oleiphilus sp. HI0078]KZZ26926.1 hypothetical protein A3752_04535 [Oleiphilus sp. HI0081]KZZ32568.1 hypothetical protein A3755_01300 [Oleiphilus sp. HI0085]